MALSTLASTTTLTFSWSAAKALTGANYASVSNNTNFSITVSQGTSAANAAVGGADELCSFLTTIGASSNTTLNLQSLTDVVLQSGVALVRIKLLVFRLLSTTDDATNGTACTGITIAPGAANAFAPFGLAGTTPTISLGNGEGIAWWTPSAAGSPVSASVKNILITNTDGAHSACVQTTVVGGTT